MRYRGTTVTEALEQALKYRAYYLRIGIEKLLFGGDASLRDRLYKHPLVKWLQGAQEDERTETVCAQVADLAEMARQPLVADRMVDFLKRSNQLLTELIEK